MIKFEFSIIVSRIFLVVRGFVVEMVKRIKICHVKQKSDVCFLSVILNLWFVNMLWIRMIYIWVYPFPYLVLKTNNVLGGSVVMVVPNVLFFKLAKHSMKVLIFLTILAFNIRLFVCCA